MKYISVILFIITSLLLSGCLYPQDNLSKNQVPNDVQLEMVQQAVDQYVEQKDGLVPIRTKPNDTPIFEKYIIDFNLLKQQNTLVSVPGNAFENGGIYQYVLITPEENPTVKLIDLRNTEKLRSVINRVNIYRSENIYPPFGEEIEKDIFQVNHELLGMDASPYVVSPYSQNNLPIVMDTQGELYIDYRIDLYQALQEFEHTYTNGDDIRYILTDNYPFVPAYSLPYTVNNGEPTFLTK